VRARVVALIAALAVAGCEDRPKAQPEAAVKKALPVETVAAPAAGEVQEIVRAELARAKGEDRRLLVYVGAAWCEPCQRFHDAAKAGQLDAAFPGLRLLEFDLDRDKERLERAGYASRMIPLFAVPRADGTGSGEQIEGSIKGPGAVDQISPRLRALLAKGVAQGVAPANN
jgi:thiol:disulfide interchange protein